MLTWFRKLIHRRPTHDELLNEGLELAMDWGESWLSPINGRLGKRHPYLGAGELEALNIACQGAMRLAHGAVHSMLGEGRKSPSLEALAAVVRGGYPWVDEENLSRLFHQGIYYAAKVGGHAREA